MNNLLFVVERTAKGRNCSSMVSSFFLWLCALITIVFLNRFTDGALIPPPIFSWLLWRGFNPHSGKTVEISSPSVSKNTNNSVHQSPTTSTVVSKRALRTTGGTDRSLLWYGALGSLSCSFCFAADGEKVCAAAAAVATLLVLSVLRRIIPTLSVWDCRYCIARNSKPETTKQNVQDFATFTFT